MPPVHPVPSGYGAPCEEGEIVTQGTGSGPVWFQYDQIDDPHDCYAEISRKARSITPDEPNIFD
jgi:hypothetical protein